MRNTQFYNPALLEGHEIEERGLSRRIGDTYLAYRHSSGKREEGLIFSKCYGEPVGVCFENDRFIGIKLDRIIPIGAMVLCDSIAEGDEHRELAGYALSYKGKLTYQIRLEIGGDEYGEFPANEVRLDNLSGPACG